jgi:hypothetical protein
MIGVIRFNDEYDLNNQMQSMNVRIEQIISITFNQNTFMLEAYFIQ